MVQVADSKIETSDGHTSTVPFAKEWSLGIVQIYVLV